MKIVFFNFLLSPASGVEFRRVVGLVFKMSTKSIVKSIAVIDILESIV